MNITKEERINLLKVIGVSVTLLVIALICWFKYSQRQCNMCIGNLYRIQDLIRGYKEIKGEYPKSLRQAFDYFAHPSHPIPSCPVTNTDTYSISYVFNNDADIFTIYCKGYNHKSVGMCKNCPKYSSKLDRMFYYEQ